MDIRRKHQSVNLLEITYMQQRRRNYELPTMPDLGSKVQMKEDTDCWAEKRF